MLVRSPGFWALILLVVLIYFGRLGDRPVRHEEPHRGQVGLEMMTNGDWVVPRQQGVVYHSRPPLQNWLIAGVAAVRGRMDAVAIRLPSALAILATVILIYWYALQFLRPVGAFAAGAAYATMGQVLELGTKGETEALFALFVAASLLLWHAGAAGGVVSVRTWVVAYLFVGLGTLTKGPQAPIYFGASVGLYLILRRRWRELFRPAHLLGLVTFAAVVLPWLIPFWRAMGIDGVRTIFFGDVELRFVDTGPGHALRHLIVFPLRLAGSLLPWSILLAAYGSGRLRPNLGRFSEAAVFLAASLAVTFPTCWFPPHAVPRYFMPLYPCLAVLIGAVVERSATGAAGGRIWSWFQAGLGGLAGLAGVGFVGVKLFAPEGSPLDQPLWLMLPFAAISLAIAALLLRASQRQGENWSTASVAGVVFLSGVLYTGLLMNVWVSTAHDVASEVDELREKLPDGVRLYSFGWVDPLFVHYWGDPVEYIPRDGEVLAAPPEVQYFCYSPGFSGAPLETLRFPWEQIQIVVCDFRRLETPRQRVYVGRVLR